jgi:hypothetical protein
MRRATHNGAVPDACVNRCIDYTALLPFAMFSRTTCSTCGRRFFGAGTKLIRFNNTHIVVCGERCATNERALRAATYDSYMRKCAAEHDAWAATVRASIQTGLWHRLLVGDTAPAHDALARVGGLPVGVNADAWPIYAGQPALHLCTLPGAPLGLAVAGLAVFAHVTRDDDGFAFPELTGAVVAIPRVSESGISASMAPRGALVIQPCRVLEIAPAIDWDPCERETSSRSSMGTIPISFEGQEIETRWPAQRRAELGRYLAQIDGHDIPWGDTTDAWREVASIYVFERGVMLEPYA